MSKKRILVVDDESVLRQAIQRILEHEGYYVATATSGHLALELVQSEDFNLVISDLKMPSMSGIEVLKSIKIIHPNVPVIIITGYASVETAVAAIKNGAFDYLAKPFNLVQVKELVDRAINQQRINEQGTHSSEEVKNNAGLKRFIGDSKTMQKIYTRILQLAPTDSSVLITGESGTGKELVARAIHENSARTDKPFVAVDCTALAESLLESELFGHEKNSFAGATRTKVGLFKMANGGTLFLDEISNISLSSQAKLLRVIQEREVTPLGGAKPQPIDIRLICATNKNLRTMSNTGKFRKDLYVRLHTMPIDIPALRERNGDLPLLVGYFLRKFSDKINKDIQGVSPSVMNLLEEYDFPGNIRELEHMIERAVVSASGDMLQLVDLGLGDDEFLAFGKDEAVPSTTEELKEVKRRLREEAVLPIEKRFVLEALKHNDWNITRAAADVGMLRPNFQALMKKLKISAKDHKVY